MNKVTVEKAGLLNAIKVNREKHRQEFETAIEGYRKEAVKILNDNIDRLKEERGHVVVFSERPPEDHTKDYDRVIRMLEMAIGDTVEISEAEFQMYVMDDWRWRNDWTTSNMKYLVHK